MGRSLLRSLVSIAVVALLLLVTIVACNTATGAPVAPTEFAAVAEEPVSEPEEADKEPVEEPVEEPADEEKVLVIGHSDTIVSYDLVHALIPTSRMVHRATYDTSVTFPDSDVSSIEPCLATSWSVSDDGFAYTFFLRDDATFANGDPLTADDVVFSFNRLINVKGNPSFLTDPIDAVEAVDDLAVAVTLVEPRPSFLAELAHTAFSIANDLDTFLAYES